MRAFATPLLVCCSVLALPWVGAGQDAPAAEPPQARAAYIVRVTEIQLRSPLDSQLTAAEVVRSLDAWRRAGKLERMETIRLSAIAHEQSMVQFGRVANVTTGVTTLPGGRSPVRQVQQQNVGTLVQLTATPHDDKVALKFVYEASRLDEAGDNESPPDTSTVRLQTQLLLAPGEPQLAGGTTHDLSSPDGVTHITSLLLVTVEK